jgi:hypothetical protein
MLLLHPGCVRAPPQVVWGSYAECRSSFRTLGGVVLSERNAQVHF